MFRASFFHEDQSYLVADYDRFSLTVGVLRFQKRVPKLESCVRSFFPPESRFFHPRTFETHFRQCCDELTKTSGTLPKEVCVFIDHGESVVCSTGYTFTRADENIPVHFEELIGYGSQLFQQSENQSKRIWHMDFGYEASERKLVSIFLSHLALDKKHHIFPLGKDASHVTMRCLFFYGNKPLLDGLDRSIRALGYTLLTCIPISCVFLNHICNRGTFLENHLHVHFWYDSTTVILHLGKHVQEIQTLPFWWEIIDSALSPYFSSLEREHVLSRDDTSSLTQFAEYHQYREFIVANLLAMFEKFGLHWSFNEYTVSGSWPISIMKDIVHDGLLSPWIQKNASSRHITSDNNGHWLQYWNTLDPLFNIHPHPLLSLVRSVFTPPHESH